MNIHTYALILALSPVFTFIALIIAVFLIEKFLRVQPLTVVDNSFSPSRLTILHDLAYGIF